VLCMCGLGLVGDRCSIGCLRMVVFVWAVVIIYSGACSCEG
jgi:hypothetical protein